MLPLLQQLWSSSGLGIGNNNPFISLDPFYGPLALGKLVYKSTHRSAQSMEGTSQNEEKVSLKLSKRWPYLIGLVVILGSEFILRDVLLPEQPSDLYIGTALAIEWLVLLMLLAYWVPKVEGNNLGSIGFGNLKWRHLWIGVLVYFIFLIVWFGNSFVLQAIGLEGMRSLQPMIREHSFPILFGLFLTGTFLEEIFYRGYLIERLTSLTGKSWLAGIMSWAAFTFVHFKFFGLGPMLDVGVLSAGLVILYLKERSIWPCIVVHGINGAFAYLISPLLML